MVDQSEETKNTEWKSMFKMGGVSALIITALFLLDMIVLVAFSPYPETAKDWFDLLQNNRLVGLLSLDILILAGFILCFPMYFALYGALKRVNKVYAAFAIVLAFAGLTILIATDKTYSMISLSRQFATATELAEKSLLLAAEKSALTMGNDSGTALGGFFVEGAALIISIIMLRSGIFGKVASYSGIVGHGLDLVRIIINLVIVPITSLAWVPTIGIVLLAIGGPLQLIWYALIGRKLLQLGRR
jgi:hypothetical protein